MKQKGSLSSFTRWGAAGVPGLSGGFLGLSGEHRAVPALGSPSSAGCEKGNLEAVRSKGVGG